MNKILCFFLGHVESPAVKIRKWSTSKGRYVKKEYQCKCERCGIKSKWMRWKSYPDAPKGWKEAYS